MLDHTGYITENIPKKIKVGFQIKGPGPMTKAYDNMREIYENSDKNQKIGERTR